MDEPEARLRIDELVEAIRATDLHRAMSIYSLRVCQAARTFISLPGFGSASAAVLWSREGAATGV